MALHHISPTKGVDACGAKSPSSCKFKTARHFSTEAAERIVSGNPKNYYETEAMHEHNAIQQKRRLENKNNGPVPKPPTFNPNNSQRPTGFPQRSKGPNPGTVKETLFHRDLGFPKGFAANPPTGKKNLEWSYHAEGSRLDDRYGEIPRIDHFNPENWSLIELGVEDQGNGRSRISKLVYRAELDDDFDMCIVVIPRGKNAKGQPSPWLVKTVWLNEANDSHKTLNRTKYKIPAEPAFIN